MYFSHQLLTFFLYFLVILINLFFWCCLLFLMFRLSLIKITVELVSSRTTLNIVFLIIVSILKISKIVLTLSSPKGILLFLFFTTNQVIHLSSSSVSKFHISNSIIFGIYLWCWFWFLIIILIITIIKIRIFFGTFLTDFLITIFLWEMLFLIGRYFFFLDSPGTFFSGLIFLNRLFSHKYNDSATNKKSNQWILNIQSFHQTILFLLNIS